MLDLHYSLNRLQVRQQAKVRELCIELLKRMEAGAEALIEKARYQMNEMDGVDAAGWMEQWRRFLSDISAFTDEDASFAWVRHAALDEALDGVSPPANRIQIHLSVVRNSPE